MQPLHRLPCGCLHAGSTTHQHQQQQQSRGWEGAGRSCGLTGRACACRRRPSTRTPASQPTGCMRQWLVATSRWVGVAGGGVTATGAPGYECLRRRWHCCRSVLHVFCSADQVWHQACSACGSTQARITSSPAQSRVTHPPPPPPSTPLLKHPSTHMC